jgi:hypothetical protein
MRSLNPSAAALQHGANAEREGELRDENAPEDLPYEAQAVLQVVDYLRSVGAAS